MSFLLGKTNNPTGALAGQYASAYGDLLSGKGNDPFTSLFQNELGPVLAQAKESTGNLTGTSLGNVEGTAAGRSLSSFLLGILGQGASFASPGAQQTYTPGFLDYLFSGISKAAPALAGAFTGGGGAASTADSGASSSISSLFPGK